MPKPRGRRGRHRAPGGQTNSILHVVLAVLAVGAAISLLGGGWLGVSYLLVPRDMGVVPYVPPANFSPVNPSFPINPTNIDKSCRDFYDRDDAQKYYIAQGGPKSDPDGLDLDKNGRACENYPYTPSHSPSKPTLEPNINDK